MADAKLINAFLQHELSRRSLDEVTAVEAARWLSDERLLKDSVPRPGKPLRDLLRAKQISGQHQEPNSRWSIRRLSGSAVNASVTRDRGDESMPTAQRAPTRPDNLTFLANARLKYRPAAVKYLLIAESPPSADSERYFYFEDVFDGDSLFWETMKAIYPDEFAAGERPPRHLKRAFLKRFHDDGFFLLDAVEEPLGKASPQEKRRRIRSAVSKLYENVRAVCGLDTKIILISAPVFDVCAPLLSAEGFNVVNEEMIDFPGSGGQRIFREKFRRVLSR